MTTTTKAKTAGKGRVAATKTAKPRSTATRTPVAKKPAAKKTSAKSASAKPAARKPAAAKAAPKPKAPSAKAPVRLVQGVAAPIAAKPASPQLDKTLRKPALIADVVTRSGAKKKDAKPVIEATLEALGAALARGEELNLPGLGKVMIQRSTDKGKARVIIARVRQSKAAASSATTPLAKPAKDG